MVLLIILIALFGLAYLWAWHTTHVYGCERDMPLITLLALLSVVNLYYVFRMTVEDISLVEHIVQMGACSCLLPIFYQYFAGRLGLRRTEVSVALWLVATLTFVPNILVYNPFVPYVAPEFEVHFFAFYVMSHGQKLLGLYTGDLVVLLQCVVLLVRLPFFAHTLRINGLHFNRFVRAFFMFLVMAVVLIIALSLMDYGFMRNHTDRWIFYCIYGVLFLSIHVMIILQYRIHLVETEAGEHVEDIETYVIAQYSKMADELRRLMEDEHLYCDSQMTVDRIVERLDTNHTYFREMMAQEMKMTFNEYLGQLRLQHVEMLLANKDLPLSVVAKQSGFADARYMMRCFKARYGLTPTEWREANV